MKYRFQLEVAIDRLAKKFTKWVERNSVESTNVFLTDEVKNRPSVKALQENIEVFKEEVQKNIKSLTPLVKDGVGTPFCGPMLSDDQKWLKYDLVWYGKIKKEARELFPKTIKILEKYDDILLCMVSCLEPEALIKPHMGPWVGFIRVHVPIFVPNNPKCAIYITDKNNNAHSYYWKDNEIVAFNDTYMHFVQNDTEQTRIVFFIDLERKLKGWWRRLFLRYFCHKFIARLTALGRD